MTRICDSNYGCFWIMSIAKAFIFFFFLNTVHYLLSNAFVFLFKAWGRPYIAIDATVWSGDP